MNQEEIVSEMIPVIDPEIEQMMKAGIHIGHSKSKSHPAMLPYIYGVRNNIAIIDLTATKEKLAKAMEFMKEIGSRGGMVLLVGTRPGTRRVLIETAEKTGMPYFIERWIGGTLTNYKVISKRVEQMETLEKDKATGVFEKYTKKERARKDEEIARLQRFFEGLRKLKRLPDAVFIVDTTHDTTAVNEAKKIKIPVIALSDTNANVSLIDLPIPSNDHAMLAVTYMLQKVADALMEGQRQAMERKTE